MSLVLKATSRTCLPRTPRQFSVFTAIHRVRWVIGLSPTKDAQTKADPETRELRGVISHLTRQTTSSSAVILYPQVTINPPPPQLSLSRRLPLLFGALFTSALVLGPLGRLRSRSCLRLRTIRCRIIVVEEECFRGDKRWFRTVRFAAATTDDERADVQYTTVVRVSTELAIAWRFVTAGICCGHNNIRLISRPAAHGPQQVVREDVSCASRVWGYGCRHPRCEHQHRFCLPGAPPRTRTSCAIPTTFSAAAT